MVGIPDDHVIPVGTWSANVQLPNSSLTATFFFSAAGGVRLETHGGAGVGHWTATGGAGFRYRVHERFTGESDDAGWIDIDQDAVQDGEEFKSSGISTLYDGNGEVVQKVLSTVVATRRSSGEPAQPADPATPATVRAPR